MVMPTPLTPMVSKAKLHSLCSIKKLYYYGVRVQNGINASKKTTRPQDQCLSTAISRVRQPIETLFDWIEQQTGIECAGKVRSYNLRFSS